MCDIIREFEHSQDVYPLCNCYFSLSVYVRQVYKLSQLNMFQIANGTYIKGASPPPTHISWAVARDKSHIIYLEKYNRRHFPSNFMALSNMSMPVTLKFECLTLYILCNIFDG